MMNTNWILNVTLQSDTFSCGCSHSQANTAKVPNCLHSLILTAVQTCQIFKCWLSLSSHNIRYLVYMCTIDIDILFTFLLLPRWMHHLGKVKLPDTHYHHYIDRHKFTHSKRIKLRSPVLLDFSKGNVLCEARHAEVLTNFCSKSANHLQGDQQLPQRGSTVNFHFCILDMLVHAIDIKYTATVLL